MKNVRVWFTKKGRAKYISHLDMNRCMQRAIKRSGLPVWYTEGFNPHIYITFALPLSLGFESDCEILDMKLTDDELAFDKAAEMLNSAMPEGIKILRIAEQKNKVAAIKSARYFVKLYGAPKNAGELWQGFIAKDEILTEKKTKKGIKTINLKEFIISADVISDDKDFCVDLVVSAGSNDNINPNLVLTAFKEVTGVQYSAADVLRRAVYTEDGTDFE